MERDIMVGNIVRGAVALCGAGALLLALGFLARPEMAAARLGLQPDGPLGLSTLRGDMSGLFALIGAFSLAAAVRRRADYLTAPTFILAVILIGRGLSAVIDGSGRDAIELIGVEIVMLGVLAAGMRTLPRPVKA